MSKPVININPDTIKDNLWVIGFFHQQHLDYGKSFWMEDSTYQYQDRTFQLSQSVLMRARKNPERDYAFEMYSDANFLGRGAYGAVVSISKTISLDKENNYQVRDKNRVVKIQPQSESQIEYKNAARAGHLHVKVPVAGHMVMKRMPGVSLLTYTNKTRLTRQERLDLTKALLHALKEQVANKHMEHSDLHRGNIMINVEAIASTPKKFVINIIDYGLARYNPQFNSAMVNTDLHYYLKGIISSLWNTASGVPSGIYQLSTVLDKALSQIEKIILSPIPQAQSKLDKYFLLLEKLDSSLAVELKDLMIDAVNRSTATSIEPMREVVLFAKNKIQNKTINQQFSDLIFDSNHKMQAQFNQITAFYLQLEKKARLLIDQGSKETGLSLFTLVTSLRENTFEAAYEKEAQRQRSLKQCSELCALAIEENKHLLDEHTNLNYIFAEVGIILASLIVLYPLVAGIHYLVTGRFCFYSQTNSAVAVEPFKEHFNELIALN